MAAIGFGAPLLIDDDLRALANRYMTSATAAINKGDQRELRDASKEAGKVLNELMQLAGARYRFYSSQVLADDPPRSAR